MCKHNKESQRIGYQDDGYLMYCYECQDEYVAKESCPCCGKKADEGIKHTDVGQLNRTFCGYCDQYID